MSKKPRFSVLIAAYNVENYIGQCLDSIHNQNFDDYEIIIIDDGSKDGTNRICQKYAGQDERIKLFCWENHGLILTRRQGIQMADGEYILFLDADDFHIGNSLEKIDRILKEKADPDILIYRFEFQYDNGDKKVSKLFGELTYCEKDKKRLFLDLVKNYEYNHLCCKAIKREIFQQDLCDYSKFSNIKLGEDLLQTIPVFDIARSVSVTNCVCYGYRVLPNSMSHDFKEQQFDDISTVYRYFEEYILKHHKDYGNVLKELHAASIIKIIGLLRVLWESCIPIAEKKRLSIKICSHHLLCVKTQLPNSLPIQNRLLFLMIKRKLWKLSSVYGSILKKI